MVTGITTLFEYGLTTGKYIHVAYSYQCLQVFSRRSGSHDCWLDRNFIYDHVRRLWHGGSGKQSQIMKLKVRQLMGQVSAHPTSGGPYFWAAMLAPTDRSAAFFSWITGWFNFLGQGMFANREHLSCQD